VLVGALPCPSRAATPVARVVDDQPFAANLVAVSSDWQLTWKLPDGKNRKTAAANLVCWGTWPGAGQGTLVVLAGGGNLYGELLALDREQLTLDSDVFGELKLPLELVAGLAPQPPSDLADRAELVRRIVTATGGADRLRLENGDELSGKLAGLKQGKLELKTATAAVSLELGKVSAVIFNPGLAAQPVPTGLTAWAGFADGSIVRLASLQLDEKSCTATLFGGVALKPDAKALVALQPLGGSVVYLSDLKADSYKHIPYLQLAWPYELDRNVTGGPLRCGGTTYRKGLGMHSAARLTYVLDQAYRRFETGVGIDDSTAGAGSVLFRVYTDDGSGKWKERFSSTTVRGGQAPLPVSIDLAGAKRISLLVEFADEADVQDHADWLDARLVK
jgi:hypothetical protein